MRVVFVNKFVHVTGGADQHCLGLAAALRARGHEVRFLSTRGDENRARRAFVATRVTHSRESLGAVEQARVTTLLWNREAAAAMDASCASSAPTSSMPTSCIRSCPSHRWSSPPVTSSGGPDAARLRAGLRQPARRSRRASRPDETKFRFRLLNEATLRCAVGRMRRVSVFVAVSRFVARVHARHGSWPRCYRTSCPSATGTVGSSSTIATASSSGDGSGRRRVSTTSSRWPSCSPAIRS